MLQLQFIILQEAIYLFKQGTHPMIQPLNNYTVIISMPSGIYNFTYSDLFGVDVFNFS